MQRSKAWRHAESYFEMLCATYGATCNKSHQDEHGWDYFVEFPRAEEPIAPLDMTPAPVKCLVQIKSTNTRGSPSRMKLSNALEFAKLEMPCFAIMLHYGDQKLPDHAVLHHFWEDEIRDTLRLSRKADANGAKPNKMTVRFPKRTGIRVDPDKLLEQMLAMITQSAAHYNDKKRTLGETLGFEDSYARGNLTYAQGVTIRDIVDLHIGLKKELPVSQFKLTSVRFGIESSVPIADIRSGGSVQIEPVSDPCELIVSSETTGAQTRLSAQIFRPSIPDLPPEELRARVVAEFADATFCLGTRRCDFRFDFQTDACLEPAALLARAELMSVCLAPDVNIRILWRGRELISGDAGISPLEGGAAVPSILAFLKQITSRNVEVRTESTPATTLKHLCECVHRIDSYLACTGDARMKAEASFDWEEEPAGKNAICYYFVSVPLDKFAVCALVRRPATIDEIVDGRTKLTFAPITYVRPFVFGNARSEYKASLNSEISRLSDGIKDIPVLNLGDILEPES